MRMLWIAALVGCSMAHAASFEDFLGALGRVESGGRDSAVGDGGRALGRYQIWRVYWQDAVQSSPQLAGEWEHVHDGVYAAKVVTAYMLRYEAAAVKRGDWETLARLHNAGPSWRKKKEKTDGYWKKVKSELKKI
jgi:hypothetical protein